MNRSLLLKVSTIVGLIVALMVPLLMISEVVDERQRLRNAVLQDIAESSSHEQKITGPLLVVPYSQTLYSYKTHEKTGERYREERTERGRLYFLPERFELQGQMTTELRARGIYEARLYHAESQVRGYFEIPENYGIEDALSSYRFEDAFLAVGISDVRGIKNNLKLHIGEQQVAFVPGSNERLLGSGVHAPLALQPQQTSQRLDFAFDLDLLGSSRLNVTPIGRESQVQLVADWPHPSFVGAFLPTQREINAQGFMAKWQTSFFATNLLEAWQECIDGSGCHDFASRQFGVSLVDPVDQYLKTERSIKYALLFIGLTFAGFFLFEVLKRLAVHPVQYALVGLSLALFFLLLVSLSEHVGFALAYGVSASACIALLVVYVSSVLRSWARGLGFGAGLTALYGVLYGLLNAEDHALLMGSVLVFGVLAGVMLLTRKLDWYSLNKPQA